MMASSVRRVVLLCGPPGAGKRAAADSSGLRVFDRADSQWSGEREFVNALGLLASDRVARAVVVRSAPTSSARRRWSTLVAATDVFLLLAPPGECVRRLRERGGSDDGHSTAAVAKWFSTFDEQDGVGLFPGWAAVDPSFARPLGLSSRRW